MSIEDNSRPQPATWRIVTAALLDFFTAFPAAALLVAFTVGVRSTVVTATGYTYTFGVWRSILLFGLVIAYFFVSNRYLGGTLWKQILRAQR